MYAFSLCDLTFSTQKSLKRYRDAVHRQSAGFPCAVCHQRFYRKDNLRRHVKTQHSAFDDGAPSSARPPDSTAHFSPPPPPEKPRVRSVWDVCRKTFSSKKTLKRHRESTHRQSAGFACRLCDQRFYEKITASDITPQNTSTSSTKHQLLTPAPFARIASTTEAI